MSTYPAKCVNLNTKIEMARMMVFRVFRKARFTVGVRLQYASRPGRRQQEESRGSHPDNHARVQPVQPLALIENASQKSQTEAEVSKPSPAWPRIGRRASTRNTEIDADHHERRDDRGRPEDPVPGEMLGIPALQR